MSTSPDRSRQPDPSSPDLAPTSTQQDVLIALAHQRFFMFHDEQDRPFGRLLDGVDRRAFAIGGVECSRHLQASYKEVCGSYPSRRHVKDAMHALESEAVLEGPQEPVFLRVARGASNDEVFLGFGGADGRACRVTPTGWEVMPLAPVNFVRRETAKSVPPPVAGGSIELLREFVNVEEESEFRLLTAWLSMTLSPTGPYPILILQGGQGSAKSTTAKVLKALIDPVSAPARPLPSSERELAISAESNWIMAFDNLSGLPTSMSDALCRLSSGGGTPRGSSSSPPANGSSTSSAR